MLDLATKVPLCESLILYTFNNKVLLGEALQTTGYNIIWHDAHIQKNDRLAVYGDIALNMALCRLWYPKKLNKGDWTDIRNIATNSNLAAVGFARGLDACMILNPGTLNVSERSMATTVEAILGAVEIDGGSDALLQVATHLKLIPESIIPRPSINDRLPVYALLPQSIWALPTRTKLYFLYPSGTRTFGVDNAMRSTNTSGRSATSCSCSGGVMRGRPIDI